MDKEFVKKMINDYIDSADAIQDFSISDDLEKIDTSTLDGESALYKRTGTSYISITVCKN